MRLWIVGAAMLVWGMADAVAEVPADRLATLSRGVNVIDVFDNKSDASRDDDLATIQAAGLHHIRIFVDPSYTQQPGKMAALDHEVHSAVGRHLGVILCMKSEIEDFIDSPRMIKLWTEGWTQLAHHYAGIDPDYLFYEVVNEPALTDVRRWSAIQEGLRQTIRQIAPHSTVLLTGTPSSTSWALAKLPPSTDDNVVYVFHDYAPMAFTHQGADWGDDQFDTIHDLRYPPEADNLKRVQRQAAVRQKSGISNYGKLGRGVVERELGPAIGWAQQYQVPLIVTEFGVYQPAPPASRAAWFRDVRTALENAKIGWTVWEYNGGFGIASDLAMRCGPVSNALGLCDSTR